MSMSIDGKPVTDDDYVCSLSPETLEKAKIELNENPKDRLSAVQALRKWVEEQPHLTWPTETRIMLTYLRGAKFSQLRARELINNVATISTELPEWFKDIDTHDPKIHAVLDSHHIVPLGKDKEGRLVVLQKIGLLDPTSGKYTKYDVMRSSGAIFGNLLRDEDFQVNGLVFFIDATGASVKSQNLYSISDLKTITRMWQNAVPMRFKGFHFYNSGAVIETIMQMMMPFLSKKFKQRMHFHGSNLETLYNIVPMELLPDEYLPDDYEGPRRGTCDQIVSELKEKLKEPQNREYMLKASSRKWGVDESKRPKEQLQQSFRKLNID